MDPIPRIAVKHIEKFDGTNFQQWKHGLTMQLELSGLQELVENAKKVSIFDKQ
ncbi:hypothetical protein DAPPUDRAFT_257747 [Daphnia pulex]|uniref:Uncharacterized protein n=1 Tax=Daphnia pulex TaxID=6669 RepID=E9HE50_DAPPU|nr:hypothetical protein DAPPUDRAFT_257747 [Daphnia pulex]|eukprot:EFX69990.1 hypothetical protein DAPPUDRAFT_257747 [Daphnia pulex]